jgi:hypothetical protein
VISAHHDKHRSKQDQCSPERPKPVIWAAGPIRDCRPPSAMRKPSGVSVIQFCLSAACCAEKKRYKKGPVTTKGMHPTATRLHCRRRESTSHTASVRAQRGCRGHAPEHEVAHPSSRARRKQKNKDSVLAQHAGGGHHEDEDPIDPL